MGYLLKYGDLNFPSTFYVASDAVENVVPVQKLGREHGARAITGTLGTRRVSVRGGLVGQHAPIGGVDIRATLDDLKQEMLVYGPANFYAGRNDRYLRLAQMTDFREIGTPTGYSARYGESVIGVEIEFVANDPHYYSTTISSDTWSPTGTAQTRTITTPDVSAPVAPTMRITVSGAGSVTIAYTITNVTTNRAFTLAGTVSGGDVIIVNSLERTVYIGNTNKMSLFDGSWLALVNGANLIRENYSGTAITTIVTEYRARWA